MKGGSSFNALVRAMKQDLVENGTVAKDPALLYEIDKVGFCLLDTATSEQDTTDHVLPELYVAGMHCVCTLYGACFCSCSCL